MERPMKMAGSRVTDEDFYKDGLRHCGICKEPRQCRIKIRGREKMVDCMCACEAEAYQMREREREQRMRCEGTQRLRSACVQSPAYRRWTFSADDGVDRDCLEKARKYVAVWSEVYKNNCGLLLWGKAGAGKTFFAACIVNALIDRNIPAMITNFQRLSDAMGFDADEYLKELHNYKLLALDDLGAERGSDYMIERIYQIIDQRYRDGQPLIVTTNLPLSQMKNTPDIRYKRIYDRILEMCVPICFDGENRRYRKHEEKKDLARALLSSRER